MGDELYQMQYRRRKRQRLLCTFTIEELHLLEAEEKKAHRALTPEEINRLFGKINPKGQRVMPDGSLWKGVRRYVEEAKNENQTIPSDVGD